MGTDGRWSISADTREVVDDAVAVRRQIHMYPEPGFKEVRTATLVEHKLKSYGVESRRLCGTGVVALIRGRRPGPTMLVRADMDGLPVREESDALYRSRVDGLMHA